MELVYLWVEEYKNIKKQGFNFSPRFECEYDEEKNELTVDEKKDYVSIFPENINVTAIVGENGSGKSNLLGALTEETQKSTFFFDNKEKNLNLHNLYNISLINENINSSLFTNKFNINQKIINKYKLVHETMTNTLDNINNLSISFLSDLKQLDNNLYFAPTHLELLYIKDILIEELESFIGQRITYLNDSLDSYDFFSITRDDLSIVQTILKQKINEAIQNKSIKDYLLIREFIFKIKDNCDCVYKYFGHMYRFSQNDDVKSVIEFIFKEFISSHNDVNFFLVIKILEEAKKQTFNDNGIVIAYDNNNIEKLEIVLVNMHRGFFDINFFIQKEFQKLFFKDLSDGEQSLLLILSKIYYAIRTTYKTNRKDFLLLLDEPDNFLHPNWQTKFIKYLQDFISNISFLRDRKILFILTSHSPFLLSDLPKENVIFLEKGKQVDVDIETFGANIHTLLSHGFFMKDGLMGDFAKNKINNAIKILNQKKLTEKDIESCENIIKITGEPILKRQMQKMLDSKRLAKVDKIDEIQRQIADLQHELKKIKDD